MVPIFVIDPSAAARQRLRQQLAATSGLHAVGQAATIDEARAALEAVDAALVLLEVSVPSELEQIGTLRRHGAPVLVYSSLPELDHAERALELGAVGFLPKTDDHEVLEEVVRSVIAGDTYLSPLVTHHMLVALSRAELAADREAYGLTDQEHEVFVLLGQRMDAGSIAAQLGKPRHHIQKIIERLQDKVGAGDTFELRCRACQTPDCMLPSGGDAGERAGTAEHVEGYGPCMHRFDAANGKI